MKKLFATLLIWLGLGAAAHAASCAAYPFTLLNNTTADATQVMSNFNTVRDCVVNNAASSGVNSDITALTGLTTPITPAQGGTPVFIGGTSTGTANAQVVASASPIGFSLTSGNRIRFIAGASNTTTMTLNVNSTGAVEVYHNSPSGPIPLHGGEIIANGVYEADYDGTNYVLLNSDEPLGGFGPATTLASSATGTTQLGSVTTHNATITGTNTINSFGTIGADVDYPHYRITFSDALTLTYNGTSMILPSGASIVTAANDTAFATYLGSGNWQVTSYQRANGTAVVNPTPVCGASGFTFGNNAGTPNTSVDYAATTASLVSTSNVPFYATGVSGTINFATNGAVNTLDTGTLTGGPTWYYIWLISDGVTTGALGSLSATSPTMPSGYIYKCRVGSIRTDSSNIFYRLAGAGNRVQFKVTSGTNTTHVVYLSSGAQGAPLVPTWVAAAVSPCAPPTAKQVQLSVTSDNNVIVAPNDQYGSILSFTNPAPIGESGTHTKNLFGDLLLESSNIYWASGSANSLLGCIGYRDAVNAN